MRARLRAPRRLRRPSRGAMSDRTRGHRREAFVEDGSSEVEDRGLIEVEFCLGGLRRKIPGEAGAWAMCPQAEPRSSWVTSIRPLVAGSQW